ncbi:hypothetical protein BS78_08G153000 [Paspalum vaginatum]|nr:hypothetical protein BS78_08G153000 [Paspalum vaginatum]
MSCLFCEEESCSHLFFDCVVAQQMWLVISDGLDLEVGKGFESIGKLCTLWGMWKLRDEFCFQHSSWKNMETLLLLVWKLAQTWVMLCPKEKKPELLGHLARMNEKTYTKVILL